MRWLLALGLFCACADPPNRPVTGTITRSSDARGLPRMLDVRAAPSAASAIEHVEHLASAWRVSPLALPVLAEVGAIEIPGGTITRVTQTIDGIPVWGGELRVLVKATGELQTITGTLVGRDRPRSWKMIDDRASAIARAAQGARVDQALARRVWYPSGDALIAAWAVDAYTSDGTARGDAMRTILAGDDGRVLERYSLAADGFDYKVYAETTGEKHPLDGPELDFTPHPLPDVPDRSYPAYLAGPNTVHVDSLNMPGDPWLAAGATETVGNNADAYVDIEAPTGLNGGDFRASVTSTGVFGHVYDTGLPPLVTQDQQMAGITSLFYNINWLHDFWYDAGFTEAAGNAQQSNYGRGGVEGDPILAESQDNALGGSRNNANMSTPDDGMSPRMQVYVWTGKDTRHLAFQPSGDTPDFGTAVFGPQNFDATGTVVVGQDGQGVDVTDGCEPYTNDVSAKLVVVDRGNCTFKRKVLNAQNANARGTIIVNNVAGNTPPPMGDDSQLANVTITIPIVSVTDTEGATLKAQIAAGTVTATLHRDVGVDLDGSLDSTLIAHEFGHYLHHRLTTCGNNMCRALSEGWGDFDALMLNSRAGDDFANGTFAIGIYATQGFTADPGYYGIRRAPYSASFSRNGLSFRHMSNGEPLPTGQPFLTLNQNAEVHNAGEVWASALWQVYATFQNASLNFTQTRAKMARFVVAGLALTPTEASPMEARDALLSAIEASSSYEHAVALDAFASRGFGSCAIAPPPDSTDFVGLRESFIVAGMPDVAALALDDSCDHDGILDSGETAHFLVHVVNRGHAPLSNVSVRITASDRSVAVDSVPHALGQMEPSASIDVPVDISFPAGITDPIDSALVVELSSDGGCDAVTTFPLAARLNVDDVANASATDTFNTADSIWTPWTAAWSHRRVTALDGFWHGDDLGVVSDTRLSSPYLQASATDPVTVTFRHRHAFETGSGTAFDGGVIEYSFDDEDAWHDLSEITSVPYTGALQASTQNPLTGQSAFTGQNPSYPDMDTVTLDLGMALADRTFRIRFRIGTDSGTAAAGWDIDDVAFTGIVGTPFPAELPDDGVCDGAHPTSGDDDPLKAGGGGCCDSGSPGGGALLSLAVLAAVLRRRRR